MVLTAVEGESSSELRLGAVDGRSLAVSTLGGTSVSVRDGGPGVPERLGEGEGEEFLVGLAPCDVRARWKTCETIEPFCE